MDFFEHQDRARRQTTRLVVLFVLAVVGIVLAVYLAVSGILLGLGVVVRSQGVEVGEGVSSFFDPGLFAGIAAGTILIVFAGSALKTRQLRGGGEVVARQLGGKPVEPGTNDPAERVLLNVVEEMAIASGTPVPPVYLLADEPGINAFAAGFSPDDAVIGVTRGTVNRLSRDELQGVIAHEFSHILNGDMRLNIRLMGILFGIQSLALVGYAVLRSLRFARFRSRGGKNNGGGAAIIVAILACAVALLVIGWIGVFFARLIQAAVSRQREFLADASAVQFTRDPGGIGGALKKIGSLSYGSRIRSSEAPAASHLFFSDGLKKGFLASFATHPPLVERIRRIDPRFDGTFPSLTDASDPSADFDPAKQDLASAAAAPAPTERAAAGRGALSAFNDLIATSALAGHAAGAEASVASVGRPTREHLGYASALVDALPPDVATAAHEPAGAFAIVCALLLGEDQASHGARIDGIAGDLEPAALGELRRLAPQVAALPAPARLPLVEIAVPALGRLAKSQYETLLRVVEQLAWADNRLSVFEYALERTLRSHLAPRFGKVATGRARFHALTPLLPEARALLSALAQVNANDGDAAAKAFAAGYERIAPKTSRASRPELTRPDHEELDRAIEKLAQSTPGVRRRVLLASAKTVEADGRIDLEEGELLRAIAASLGCPMPPLSVS